MDTNPALDHQHRPNAQRHDGGGVAPPGSAAPSASPGKGDAGAESTIREMARDFGISIRALRFYEDRGLLHPRREGALRLYGLRERRDLKSILKAKQLGFTLSEIHDMLRSRSGPLVAVDSQERDGDRFSVDETELELPLPPEQIVAQIGYLERQRKDLDAAIVALRNAHRRMLESPGRAALA
jgi:DNA-binding transcriptional MerR regulator